MTKPMTLLIIASTLSIPAFAKDAFNFEIAAKKASSGLREQIKDAKLDSDDDLKRLDEMFAESKLLPQCQKLSEENPASPTRGITCKTALAEVLVNFEGSAPQVQLPTPPIEELESRIKESGKSLSKAEKSELKRLKKLSAQIESAYFAPYGGQKRVESCSTSKTNIDSGKYQIEDDRLYTHMGDFSISGIYADAMRIFACMLNGSAMPRNLDEMTYADIVNFKKSLTERSRETVRILEGISAKI